MRSNSHANAYRGIFEQYIEQASFLWLLRSIAVDQPHYNAADLADLERRIDAQLDGLMTSIEQAWEICREALAQEEPGEIFTSAVIAFKSHDMAKIQKVVEAGLSSEVATPGLISAMGWLPAKLVNPWVNKFFSSKDLDHKYLALAACSVRRDNPREHLNRILEREDCKEYEKLYARALRLIGELGRVDLMPALKEASALDDDHIKFWSNWSAVLLGNRAAVEALKPFVFEPGQYQAKAISLVFRVLPMEQARSWISELAKDGQQIRASIQSTAVLGDPQAVNWLIGLMADIKTARVAAEAFSTITGIDLELEQLVAEPPANLPEHPSDDADDEDVSLDEDENLPWPDAGKLKSLWKARGGDFATGQRYFTGKNIAGDSLNHGLANGNQRQRAAAALELVLIDAATPLANTHAKVPA